MKLSIRDAGFDDALLLARWAQAMALETEGRILPAADIIPGVERGIATPGLARDFVAE